MRPVVRGLEQAYSDRIEFQEYNIASEEGESWANQYSLFGHPAFLLLDSQGEERWRSVGIVPRELIEAKFAAVLP